jgi:Sensors of blue-light using FAD
MQRIAEQSEVVMLVRCLYVSRPAKPLSPAVLEPILEKSRVKNPSRGITGLLCYQDHIFVQVLEGGRDAVCDLFNTIVRDDRHTDVRLLDFEEIAERRFSNWTMGKVNIESINPGILLKYSEKVELNPYICSGKVTMALLLELAASGSIGHRG